MNSEKGVHLSGLSPGILSRRLLTILAADVVGYARLTEAAETETHIRLRDVRTNIVNPSVVAFRGQIVRNTGDGFLATFDSALDGLNCAIHLQSEISADEHAQAPDRKIELRMGLNVGDFIVEPDDIYGAGVNIAARLEQLASPGGILISAAIREHVGSAISIPLDDLGDLRLKNIVRPVRAYALRVASATPGLMGATRSRTAGRAKIPSIVVLPFKNLGADPSETYFGSGIVEDIIFTLASIKGLLVIARTSALTYGIGSPDVQTIGEKMGVRYVLSGNVRRTGGRLRIGAELADLETNSVIWADRYDGEMAQLFELQDRLASRIVWSIAPRVREAELARARRKRPRSMNAYDLVMQAIDLIYRMKFAEFSRARGLLAKAIELDDSYPAAYTYAALWHIHNVNQGWTHDQEADSREAARLASAAVERDPTDGFSLAVHGHTKSVLFRDFDAAIAIFDRALDAAPSNAMVWALSSGTYSYKGDGAAAVARAERGLRLSPVDTQAFYYLAFLCAAHYVNGTFEQSVIWGRKGMELNPNLCSTLRWLIGSLVALGQIEEARHVANVLQQVQPRFTLQEYARWCPLTSSLRSEFLERLKLAGLPSGE
ncbi:adenylate/guanylate cyclase domain-containing protein [Variovorax saccharolyticus]|uniref:adenylate/guanylate cyclase domain-containing protein n=1 Tax=Variovorax saccharolyticus TaxID=3053516 RepID=UPI002577B9ED|nr:adenylate/guanylate cyclase domain-containing protein [Variovorax sp. J22R187]MDM0020532.1 adenylate/guanylate cyclase domain-containing protein [Variovorax sp. J22R187]